MDTAHTRCRSGPGRGRAPRRRLGSRKRAEFHREPWGPGYSLLRPQPHDVDENGQGRNKKPQAGGPTGRQPSVSSLARSQRAKAANGRVGSGAAWADASSATSEARRFVAPLSLGDGRAVNWPP